MVGINKKIFSRDKADRTNLERMGKIQQGGLHGRKKSESNCNSHRIQQRVMAAKRRGHQPRVW